MSSFRFISSPESSWFWEDLDNVETVFDREVKEALTPVKPVKEIDFIIPKPIVANLPVP